MSEAKALVRVQPASTEVTPQVWQQMLSQAKTLVMSGLLPNSIKTPEQAVVIMLKGREMGMPPMQAFNHINVIQGKPTLSSEAMLAQIQKVHPRAKVEYEKLDSDGCTIVATRPGHKPVRISFTMEDAKKAGLAGKDNWHKFPRAMLRSRCISEMARSVFPDALMGASYTPEELAPDLPVNEDGEVTNAPTPSAEHFDPGSSLHVRRLEGQLKAQNVHPGLWPTVKLHMAGLEMNKRGFDAAVTAAKAELAVKDQQRFPALEAEVLDEPGDPES